jgi:predicted ATPase
MNQKVTKIVFSGGPGVGKTTILKALKNLGVPNSKSKL